MSNKLFLSWKTPNQQRVPIGQLEYKNGYYLFQYTKGALKDNFRPFDGMKYVDRVYESKELFPFFKNRLLQ